MANWTVLKAAIADVIKTNGNQEITGAVLQNTLNSIVSTIGENATFAGIATPSTNPGAPDGPIFYFATQAGTYTNFGSVVLNEGLNILLWNGTSWAVTKVMNIVQELGTSENTVMSQKAVTNIIGLDEYPTFSESTAYSAGDAVNYNGKLYQFTADHAAGAWIGSDAEETNIINITNWQIKLAGANDILNTFVKGSAADIFKNKKTFISGDGSIGNTQNANYYTTDYIPIDIAKNWVIKSTGYNSMYPTAVFYNEAFALLDTYFLKSEEHDLVITDDILSLYPETKYVIYASYDKDLTSISVENNINSLAENIATNADDIANLSKEVRQNTDNVTDLSGKVSSVEISTIGNLLYGAEVTQGYYLEGGTPMTSGGWSISPFIEVEANQEYIYKNIKISIGHDFFYDKDQNMISSISYVDIEENANDLHKYTTPENCKYVRLSFNTRTPNLTNNIYLVRSDGFDYALEGKKTIINANMRIDNIIGFTKNKMTHNLLDVHKIVRNTYLTGFNAVQANSSWSTTPIIRVKPNTKYALLNGDNCQIINPQHSFYGNKYFTQIGAIESDEDGTFTTPEDCAYVQLSIQNYSDKLVLQEVDDNGRYYYIPYGLESENQDILHSPFLGKKICVVGDSTTEGGQWMLDVAQNLGMWLYVNAIGSTTVAYNDSMGSETTSMCTDTRISAIPEDADIIVFAGGLNDWSAAGIPLGTLEGEHTHDTFYGAYQLMLDKAFARCPNARFVLAELTYRHQGTANTQGATMMDYRNAVRAIAEKYCYPILPMYKNAGINAVNYTQFARDEGDLVHRNDLGNRRLGRVATAAMLAMV